MPEDKLIQQAYRADKLEEHHKLVFGNLAESMESEAEVIAALEKPGLVQTFIFYDKVKTPDDNIKYQVSRTFQGSSEVDAPIHIARLKNRWYRLIMGLSEPLLLRWIKCGACHRWFRCDLKKGMMHLVQCHRCKMCGMSTRKEGKEHQCTSLKLRTFVPDEIGRHTMKFKATERPNIDWFKRPDVMVSDFETFANAQGSSIVYAAGWAVCDTDQKLCIAYGPEALNMFMEQLNKREMDTTVFFWNGSAFDMLPVLNWLMRQRINMPASNFVKKGKRILTCHFVNEQGKTITFKDMFLFVPESLANACKSFNVPDEVAKSYFDHSKVTGWPSVVEHEKEVIKYLRNDVLSLRQIVQTFGANVLDKFAIDFSTCITISHLGITVWKAVTPHVSGMLHIPSVEEYNEWYTVIRGGRVIPQLQYWTSEDGLECPYDQLQSYCTMWDCNSLYPYSMTKLFPTGPYTIRKAASDFASLIEELNQPRDQPKGNLDFAYWSMFEVDVECPRDLFTPYLPSRSANGSIEYTLLPKTKEKYVGFELLHAASLGYRVTHIHSEWRFTENVPTAIYKDFVDQCYQGRLQHPAPHALNAIYKYLMNSVYGKKGQKPITKETAFISGGDEDLLDALNDVIETQAILDADGSIMSYLVTMWREEVKVAYPFYLAGYILAYSRTVMSNALKAVNGYKQSNRAMHYTDTDSLVLSPSATMAFPATLKGNELGLFKDDLKGGRIIRSVYLAPKTYCLVYKTPDNKLWTKVRCKGIPHTGAAIETTNLLRPHDPELAEKLEVVRAHYLGQTKCKYVDVGFRAYEAVREDGKRIVSNHLCYQIYLWMAQGKLSYVSCTFGTMQVVYASGTGQGLSVVPTYNARTLASLGNTWWDKQKRKWDAEKGMSIPLGHEDW